MGWSDIFAPEPARLRQMLLELRKKHRWSQRFTAAVLGVSLSALIKWEAGKRNPNGAAAKLIFLLHSLIVEKSAKVKNAWDLASWGTFPCRDSLAQAAFWELTLNGTHFLPEGDLVVWWGIQNQTTPESEAWFPII